MNLSFHPIITTATSYRSKLFPHTLWLIGLALITPIILLGTFDLFDKKHTIIANYPIFGRFRYVMEELRPKIYQYFIESDTDGTPINRVNSSVVYQRPKKSSTQRHLEHK